MKQFRRRWGRMLLPALLVLTAAIFSILGCLGKDSIYRKYSVSFPKEPWLMLVFEGAHDGIWPWELYSGYAQRQKEKSDSYAGVELPDAENAEDISSEDTQTAETGTAVDPVEILPEGEKDDTADADGLAQAHRGDKEGQTETEDTTQEPEPDERYAPLKETGKGSIPKGVCDEVAPAVDYGSSEPSYLSPADTVYNTDKKGIFARSGVYYPLQSVDREYLSDALFIGDSRTQGLWEYGGIGDIASFCCRESVTTFTILEDELDFGAPGETVRKVRLKELLKERSFRKIYIALGINEVGYPNSYTFYERYRELLTTIRKLQPDAILYIQGMLHVTEELSRKDICLNNTIIVQRNKAVSTLANGHDIFYLDMNPWFCDENGNLFPEHTGDGVHLMGSICGKWSEYLLGHAVLRGIEDEGIRTGSE